MKKSWKQYSKWFCYGMTGLFCILTISGCEKYDNVLEPEREDGVPFELYVTPQTTRTSTTDGLYISWIAGDKLSVFNAISESAEWRVGGGAFSIDETELSNNKFIGTLPSPLEVDTNYDWLVVYPYNSNFITPLFCNDLLLGNKVGEKQVQRGNNSKTHLAGAHIPLYGKAHCVPSADKLKIALDQTLAVIRVHVTNTKSKPLTVRNVEFTATEDIIGIFNADFSSEIPVYTPSEAGATASLMVDDGEALEKNASADFYLAIKPFSALPETVLNVKVNEETKTIAIGNKAVNFEAGKIKTINFNYDAIPVVTFSSEVIEINEETIWEQESEISCTTEALIKVTTGQRLLFRHGNYHLANKLTILGYEDKVKNSEPILSEDLVLPREIWAVPDNVNYIRLKSVTSGATLTATDCTDDNFHVIDVSGNTSQSGSKLWDWNHATSSLTQGMACSNGYCFQAFADGYVDIWDIESKTFIESVFFPVASDAGVDCMHLNNLCFGDKYESGDTFGILWGNNESIGSSMVGVRVTKEDGHFVFTKVAETHPPYSDENLFVADDQYMDFQNKRMVQVVYKKNDAVTIPRAGFSDTVISYYGFDMLTPEVDYTSISQFEFPIMWAMQGGRLFNDMFYLVSGVEGSANCINIFNMTTRKCVEVVDLSRDCFGISEEPQGLEFYQGKTYLSTVNGFYEIKI